MGTAGGGRVRPLDGHLFEIEKAIRDEQDTPIERRSGNVRFVLRKVLTEVYGEGWTAGYVDGSSDAYHVQVAREQEVGE
jgi:hypothetical protein